VMTGLRHRSAGQRLTSSKVTGEETAAGDISPNNA
jgi:hypothetical protein